MTNLGVIATNCILKKFHLAHTALLNNLYLRSTIRWLQSLSVNIFSCTKDKTWATWCMQAINPHIGGHLPDAATPTVPAVIINSCETRATWCIRAIGTHIGSRLPDSAVPTLPAITISNYIELYKRRDPGSLVYTGNRNSHRQSLATRCHPDAADHHYQ